MSAAAARRLGQLHHVNRIGLWTSDIDAKHYNRAKRPSAGRHARAVKSHRGTDNRCDRRHRRRPSAKLCATGPNPGSARPRRAAAGGAGRGRVSGICGSPASGR